LHLYDTTQEDSVEVEVLADHNAERAAVGVVVVSGLDVRNAVTDYQAANRITQGESLANMISATTRSELDEQTRRESSRTISVKLNHQPYAVAHTRFNNTLTVVRLKAEDCLPFENGVKIQERVDALTRAAYGHILWQASAGGDTSPPRSNQSQP
jgi:hypothetical protein